MFGLDRGTLAENGITPEMIEAGVDAFGEMALDLDDIQRGEIVARIYRAMEAARKRSAPQTDSD